MAKAAKETSNRNGNSQRVIETARDALTASKPGAIIFTRRGEKNIPTKTTENPAMRRIEKACFARYAALSLPF